VGSAEAAGAVLFFCRRELHEALELTGAVLGSASLLELPMRFIPSRRARALAVAAVRRCPNTCVRWCVRSCSAAARWASPLESSSREKPWEACTSEAWWEGK
jgi:hypothetical protein